METNTVIQYLFAQILPNLCVINSDQRAHGTSMFRKTKSRKSIYRQEISLFYAKIIFHVVTI